MAAPNNGLSQPPRLSLNASLQTATANVFFLFSSAPNPDAPIQAHTTQYLHLSFPAPYFTRRTLIQLSTIRYSHSSFPAPYFTRRTLIQLSTIRYLHLSFPAPYFTRRTLIQLSTIRYLHLSFPLLISLIDAQIQPSTTRRISYPSFFINRWSNSTIHDTKLASGFHVFTS